jgi:hypothetical protein
VVDKSIIKRPRSSSSSRSKLKSRRRRRRRRFQHLCLDKGYKSEQEEQELIKRGYILHIPVKKKKKKIGEEDGEEIAIPSRKKYSSKRWVVERTNSWHFNISDLFIISNHILLFVVMKYEYEYEYVDHFLPKWV